ncbi:hypothetical protein M407DRAFT_31159 [Tulasnella calospora MUT 4182]|uniref:Uncharacterized protein n=1 Tax=Tulasnella calospora MUT 4182 TaxID=1051891 RepID=A0A0C3Q641_9AGAM|nr:hypothetical protein M407DRAFT_31159 [Tulasnella calospora MUT 4182]
MCWAIGSLTPCSQLPAAATATVAAAAVATPGSGDDDDDGKGGDGDEGGDSDGDDEGDEGGNGDIGSRDCSPLSAATAEAAKVATMVATATATTAMTVTTTTTTIATTTTTTTTATTTTTTLALELCHACQVGWLAVGSRQSAVGDRMIGSWRPESWRSEVGGRQSAIGNRQSESGGTNGVPYFDYRHGKKSVDFTLLNDFEVDWTDSTGMRRIIPRADTSKNSIRCTIQRIMRSANPDDKIVFFLNMMGLQVREDSDFQCIIAGDDRRIYGTELRSWFFQARYPSVAVTNVFDACHSGGSLGLHISYDIKGKIVKASNGSRKRVRLSNCQRTECPTIEGLVVHLDENCDPTGAQVPQVWSSRKIKGRIALF